MNQHNVLNQPTKVLLTITALLAVIVLANWLWTLTTFWSDIYVGANKLQMLFYYSLYCLPILIIVGIAFWAFYTKNPIWLVVNILLSFLSYYFIYGAIWLLRDRLAQLELIEQVPLMNKWIIFILIILSAITFVYYWVNNQISWIILSRAMKYLTIYIVLLSIARLVISNFTFATFSPLLYLAGNQSPLIEQFLIILTALPETLLILLALWAIITQRLYYFGLITLIGYYNTFLSQFPLIKGMKYNWGETDILAITGTVSAISMLVLYISSFVIFSIWLYHWKQEKK